MVRSGGDTTFGALGCQQVPNMSSKIDAKIGMDKKRFQGRPVRQKCTELVARRGVRGEVNLHPGGRRFGRKEERKQERKKEERKT